MIRQADRRTLTAEMPLTEFYSEYVHPIHRIAKEADPKTIALDRVAMNYWARFTGDPPLSSIDEFVCADFVAGLRTLPGRHGRPIAKSTICKHIVHAQFALDRAGPRSRHMRNAARLIPEPPGIEKPKAAHTMRPPLTMEQLQAWLDAAKESRSPRGVDSAAWWQSLIVFAYNTGLRIDCVMRLEWAMLQGEWIDVPAEIFKGHEHGGLFYVNRHAREALSCVRSMSDSRIFPWKNWPNSSSWLQENRRRQWRAAGHAAGNDMLAGHYVDRESVIPELLEQLPQPGGASDDMDVLCCADQ